jgi:hypothetical protein
MNPVATVQFQDFTLNQYDEPTFGYELVAHDGTRLFSCWGFLTEDLMFAHAADECAGHERAIAIIHAVQVLNA